MAVFRVGGQVPKIHTVTIIISILPVVFPDHWLSHIQWAQNPCWAPLLCSLCRLCLRCCRFSTGGCSRKDTGDAISRCPMLEFIVSLDWTRQCHSPVSRQVVMLTHADTTLRRGWTFIHRMPFSRCHYYTARWMVGCFILTVNMHIHLHD